MHCYYPNAHPCTMFSMCCCCKWHKKCMCHLSKLEHDFNRCHHTTANDSCDLAVAHVPVNTTCSEPFVLDSEAQGISVVDSPLIHTQPNDVEPWSIVSQGLASLRKGRRNKKLTRGTTRREVDDRRFHVASMCVARSYEWREGTSNSAS